MASIEIVDLVGTRLEQAWDAYVASAPNGSCYHALVWREILSRSFGHDPYYLAARAGGAIVGVLPLFEMKSWLFGHYLVSLPFVNYGGILADRPDVEAALAEAAMHLAVRRGAGHIELRQSFASGLESARGWQVRHHKAALVVPIEPDPERHWVALSSRLRGKVRKAERAGAVFSRAGTDGLDRFYRVFAKNMRDLGTPVHRPQFFRTILERVRGAQILLVELDGRPVAAALAIPSRDTIELPWIASDYDVSSRYVNEFLYWKAIEMACGAGVRHLDLGRSTIGAGTYTFKLQWQPEVVPLFWSYWLPAGGTLPELAPTNPKFALAITCWKKLPIRVANGIGPHIVRNIP
ncbi:FemAB family PEP-CTERM system-associated protein [Chelatococcus daeguensis]|uniref:FemAB family XrtA/PEP-CTERM system-associated protein n=1 Tax=Chelatococcus daeguensis TaxID=444444 RepID=UPI0007ABE248|nr:FemAB family XrtA/PEP-CTERM system-associated protein [Chelatococcus daeguensis]KZE28941.1 hypothetical protein AVW15_03765 [Chelatococcus daeguensis]MBM3083628.1 FemAB family PEP-CTERM system-associated protein [Chelatococcus daeguensis]